MDCLLPGLTQGGAEKRRLAVPAGPLAVATLAIAALVVIAGLSCSAKRKAAPTGPEDAGPPGDGGGSPSAAGTHGAGLSKDQIQIERTRKIAALREIDVPTAPEPVLDDMERRLGAIVRQDPTRDDASRLLEQVRAEKTRRRPPPGRSEAEKRAAALSALRAAIRAGHLPEARAKLRDIGPGGASVTTERRQIEAMETIASLKPRVARAGTVAELERLERLVRGELGKYPGYRGATTLIREITRAKEAIGKKDDRPFKAAMAEGKRYEGNRSTLRQAEDKYRQALSKAPGFRERSEANRGISRVRQLRGLDTILNDGQRALGRGAYREAQSSFTDFQTIMRHYISGAPGWVRTEQRGLAAKIDSAKKGLAKQLVVEAENTADLQARLRKLEEAKGVSPSAEIAARITAVKEQIKAIADRGSPAQQLDRALEMILAGEFIEARPALDSLAAGTGTEAAHAKKLLKAGPGKEEVLRLAKAAAPVYAQMRKDLAPLKKEKQWMLVIIKCEAVQPAMKYTRYEARVKKEIASARDATYRDMLAEVRARAAKMTDLDQRISSLERELRRFPAGTSGRKAVQVLLAAAKKQRAEDMLSRVKARATRTPDLTERISYLESELHRFPEGSSGRKAVQGLLAAAKNRRASDAYRAHRAVLARIGKDPDGASLRIAVIQKAVANPVFADTAFKGRLEAALQREKDAGAAGRYEECVRQIKEQDSCARRVALIQESIAKLAGTKYVKTLEAWLAKERTYLMRGSYAKLKKHAAKLKTLQMKLSLFESSAAEYAGTSWAKHIKADIEKLKEEIKEPVARKVYAGAIKRLNKKAYRRAEFDANIAGLHEAALKLKGTRYAAAIHKLIKMEEAKKKKAKK